MQNKQGDLQIMDDKAAVLFMIKTMLEINGYKITAKDDFDNIESFVETYRSIQP